MNRTQFPIILFLCIFFPGISLYASDVELPSRSNVIAVAKKVNNSWITNHLEPGNNEWPRATYFVGNLELYKACRKQSYLDYALKWAESNNWAVNGGPSTSNADNHACGQVYVDLFLMDEVKDSSKIEAIRNAIDYRIKNNPQSSDWWWIDALFMAMPTITRLGVVCDDTKYFDKLYALFSNTRDTLIVNSSWSASSSQTYAPGPIVTCPVCGNESDGLFNRADGLWWRDWRYQPDVPPQNNKPKQSPNGKNIYWSRGNGWVFAALARTLEFLPATDPHRQEYVDVFRQMAASLKSCQREDGFWNMNLGDPEHYPAPETSGTAFFTYGMAWGINNGLLDSAAYFPVAAKAWNGLSTVAIESNGNIKYAQNVGETPTDPSGLTTKSVDFAVGAVLLAAAEVSKLAFDDGLPDDVPDGEGMLLDRTEWTIITSSVGAVDDNVWGNRPEYIIDGDNQSAFLFVKPGLTYKGVSVPSDTKPWFAIDLKQISDMSYIYYRHRDFGNNTSSYLRANKASFYAKNTESEIYRPVMENFDIATNETGVRIDFPEKWSSRYVKFVFEGWNTSSGNTIQVSEFYLGNKSASGIEESLVGKDAHALKLNVYPNPVRAGLTFFVEVDENAVGGTMTVYSMNGMKLSTSKIIDIRTKQVIRKQGVYLIEVKCGDRKQVAKMIVL